MLKKKIVCALLSAALITAMAVPAISLEDGAYAATVAVGASTNVPSSTATAETAINSTVGAATVATTTAAIAGGETAATTDAAIATDSALASPTADVIPLQTKKSLSLDQALAIMTTTGTRAAAAALNKKSDTAVGNGYSETVKKIKTAQSKISQADAAYNAAGQLYGPTGQQAFLSQLGVDSIVELAYNAQVEGVTDSNKKVMQLRRDFARKYTDANYDADMNQIEQDTISVYSKVLLAESNYQIAQDNLAAQQKNLKNVNAKKAVGLLSKKDVLQAQSAVTDAESQIRAAKTTMDYAHMSFNYLLGYNVMQEVAFTDRLVATTDGVTAVDAAIGEALKNRNEIAGADFAVQAYQVLMNDVKAYPKNSSTYMTAEYNLMNAQQTAKNARSQIEIDIRNQAAIVADKKAALEAAKSLQAYASEGVRLMTLTNEEGLSTVEELLETQVSLYKANLNLANATSEYNLAVRSYQDAQGIGTMRIPL